MTNRVFLTIGIVLLSASAALAGPVNVSWTSTNFTSARDSRLGNVSVFANLSTTVVPASIQAVDTTSSPTPPLTGINQHVEEGFVGAGNFRQANSSGSAGGSTAGTMSMLASTGAGSVDNNVKNTVRGAQGVATTSFVGEFVSNGTALDFDYNGAYSLFAFIQQSVGGSLSFQRAFARAQIDLVVQDLTAATTLFSGTVFAAQFLRGGFGVDNPGSQALSGGNSIDMTGLAGDDIRVTVTAQAQSRAYAGLQSFDSSGQATGAQASAWFDGFDFTLTTGEGAVAAPAPASLALFGVGLAAFGLLRRRHRAA